MRKLILLTLLLISTQIFGQYPLSGNPIGGDSTLSPFKGAVKGRLINFVFIDTAAANAQRFKYYSGAQLYTQSDSVFWIRNSLGTRWLPIGGGSAGGGGGGSQTWQQTLTAGSALTGNNTIAGANTLFNFGNIKRFTFGTASIDSPFVWNYGGTDWLKLQIFNPGVRFTTAQNSPLQLAGGVSPFGMILNPDAYSSTGGFVALSHHDLGMVDFSFFPGSTAAENSRFGMTQYAIYLKGIRDSVGVNLFAKPPSSVRIDSSRFTTSYGTTTASENSLTLPFNGNTFNISGTTQINAITTYAWQTGSIIYLKTTGSLTFADNTAGGAGTAPIQLSGNNNFTTSAGDLIALQYDGTDWTEIGRSYANVVNGANIYNSDGTLTGNRTVSGDGKDLYWNNMSDFLVTSTSGDVYLTYNDGDYDNNVGVDFSQKHLLFQSRRQGSGFISEQIIKDSSIHFYPFRGNFKIDSLNTTFETSRKKVLLQDTLTGLVTRIDPSSLGTTYTASEGITLSGSDFQLGGTVSSDRTLTLGANTILITANTLAGDPALSITSTSTAATSSLQKGINVDLSGANSNSGQLTYAIYTSNTHTGSTSTNYGASFNASGGSTNIGVLSTATDIGVSATATTGVLGQGTGTALWGIASGSGIGLQANSVDGYATAAIRNPSSTNTVVAVGQLARTTSGTGADGIGGSIDLFVETDNGTSGQLSNQIIWKWSTAANATRTSQFIITGVNSAVTADLFTLSGSGALKLNKYGINTFAGSAAYALGVDASGNVVEFAAGGSVAWNGITNPTGDQALTFDAGESSTWTDANTTEDLFTANSSTGTTNSMFSLNRTGTALAAGNNIMELISSGANGTNAITATGLRVSVTNTNATSGTNTAITATASGATTANIAAELIGKLDVTVSAGDLALFVGQNGASNYLYAADNSPSSAENYMRVVYSSNFGILEASHGAAGNFAIRNISGPLFLQSAVANSVILYPASTQILTATSTGVGIGTTVTSPTARLHIIAGTATASTAPLKFNSGTNLTTAEAGAMEYNGTNLFFSPSTTRYTVQLALEGSASLDFGSTAASSSADLTITVTGASDGDVVSLGVPNGSVNNNSSYTAWVSAANTVSVRFNNYQTVGAIDPASGTFKISVRKP